MDRFMELLKSFLVGFAVWVAAFTLVGLFYLAFSHDVIKFVLFGLFIVITSIIFGGLIRL